MKAIPSDKVRRSRVENFASWLSVIAVCGAVSFWFLKQFDTSDFERAAKGLVGKRSQEVRNKLGAPDEVHPAAVFNRSVRSDIRVSFVPKEIPMARGSVWTYNRIPTIVLVFVEDDKVVEVYVGKT
jgi:hypothetical protein